MKSILITFLTLLLLSNVCQASVDTSIAKRFRRIIQLVQSDNAKDVSKLIAYPLKRENPLPDFVRELQKLPDGAIYDVRSSKFHALYYQTVHQRPMAYGYIARVARSVDAKSTDLRRVFEMGDYARLYSEYGFRYLILPRDMNVVAALGAPLYQDNDAQIYDLSNSVRRALPQNSGSRLNRVSTGSGSDLVKP